MIDWFRESRAEQKPEEKVHEANQNKQTLYKDILIHVEKT